MLAETSSEKSILNSQDGIEHSDPDDLIDIKADERFTTRKWDLTEKSVDKPIRYTVNGAENTTRTNPLSLEFILRDASRMQLGALYGLTPGALSSL